NRVVASLSGAAIMLILKLITQEKAFLKIDFNTIGLLVGMMIICIIYYICWILFNINNIIIKFCMYIL
ncbi:hypothetical protein FC755_16005, partial [Clostridium sporogenes]|nr:hypothetical protein [Clostridium sporogenes]